LSFDFLLIEGAAPIDAAALVRSETAAKQAANKGQTTAEQAVKQAANGGQRAAKQRGNNTMNRLNGDALNGAAKRTKAAAKRARPSGRKAMRYARGLAVGWGGVGVGVLGLSVVHCTESIELLTGSHWALAGLLAVGIDAGMVASELAEVASHGTGSQCKVRPWAVGYTVAAVLLSVLLNAYAFGLHAHAGMVWAAWLLGAVIPGLVYALGRVSGHLWLSYALRPLPCFAPVAMHSRAATIGRHNTSMKGCESIATGVNCPSSSSGESPIRRP
jgi:hypothetical protein